PLRPRPTSGGEGVGELGIEVAGRERGQAVLLGGRAGVHDDVALTAVERAELAGGAGLAGVGLALDRSRHEEPPEVRGHSVKWAASESQRTSRLRAGRVAARAGPPGSVLGGDRDGLLRGRLRVPRHEDLELALGDHVAVLVRALGDLEVGGVAIRGGPGDVAGGVLDLAGDLLAGRRVDALVDRLTRRALGGGD